jgi:hypothetical protein
LADHTAFETTDFTVEANGKAPSFNVEALAVLNLILTGILLSPG